MDLGIRGKRALVMGSSSGLGLAIAKLLIQEGVKVCLASRKEASLQKVQEQINAHSFIVTDSTQLHSGKIAVEDACHKLGGIDILVTNTGGPPKGSFLSVSAEQWQEGFQSLWLNAVDSIRTVLPEMQKMGWGRILLITSAAAREPMPGLTISNGFRAGLLGLTKSISNEVAEFGVTINALLPGYTRTERLKELKIPEEKITSQIPAKRLGEPEEFAAMAVFLASAHAGYVSGQMIAVDGGYLRGI